jgi:hypothetical protein
MGRNAFRTPDEKLTVVLSVLKGETTQVEAARRLAIAHRWALERCVRAMVWGETDDGWGLPLCDIKNATRRRRSTGGAGGPVPFRG